MRLVARSWPAKQRRSPVARELIGDRSPEVAVTRRTWQEDDIRGPVRSITHQTHSVLGTCSGNDASHLGGDEFRHGLRSEYLTIDPNSSCHRARKGSSAWPHWS